MKRMAAVTVSLLVLVVSGLLHGYSSERWTSAPALTGATARVGNVPMQVGDWKAEALESDAAAFFQAGAQAYWTRSYVNSRNKDAMLVILMCGRSGRMAVHTPEVCYRGAGFEMDRAPETFAVSTSSNVNLGSFWSAGFSKEAGAESNLRLLWAWGAKDGWQASTRPRWDFGGEPFLYKLYVSHEDAGTGSSTTKAITAFMRQFLPAVNKTLFDDAP